MVSCEGHGEALTGVRAGWVIEPRNHEFRVPTLLVRSEGNTAGGVMRELLVGPARSESHGMCGVFMRENREVPCLPAGVIAGWAVRGTLRRYA